MPISATDKNSSQAGCQSIADHTHLSHILPPTGSFKSPDSRTCREKSPRFQLEHANTAYETVVTLPANRANNSHSYAVLFGTRPPGKTSVSCGTYRRTLCFFTIHQSLQAVVFLHESSLRLFLQQRICQRRKPLLMMIIIFHFVCGLNLDFLV